jgi:hypothetical protein
MESAYLEMPQELCRAIAQNSRQVRLGAWPMVVWRLPIACLLKQARR